MNGVRSDSLPSEISSPAGSLATVRSAVRGISVALCLVVRPAVSVAVTESSRCDGYSWSGATKLPDPTPT